MAWFKFGRQTNLTVTVPKPNNRNNNDNSKMEHNNKSKENNNNSDTIPNECCDGIKTRDKYVVLFYHGFFTMCLTFLF